VNPPVLHRRRIERYAQLLDEAGGARRHHTRSPIDDELANMLAVNRTLATVTPDLAPSETYRMEGRAEIMAAAERLGVGRTYREDTGDLVVSRPAVGRASVGTVHESASRRVLPGRRAPKARLSPNHSRARGAILVGLAVGTLALSGISAASGDAMPGSALYRMKVSAENAQISFAGSDVNKGKLYLQDAQLRAAEAQQVSSNASLLDTVLPLMNTETDKGTALLFSDAVAHRSVSDLNTVNGFVTYQLKQLASLRAIVTSSESDKVVQAINHLNGIRTRSDEIAQTLNCASTLKITGHDTYGPVVTCQVGASGATNAPAHRTDGAATGSGTKPAEKTAVAEPKAATSPAGITPSPAVSTDSTDTPDPTTSYDGGLLGSVEHLLGGL
jgi:hypothetical protein